MFKPSTKCKTVTNVLIVAVLSASALSHADECPPFSNHASTTSKTASAYSKSITASPKAASTVLSNTRAKGANDSGCPRAGNYPRKNNKKRIAEKKKACLNRKASAFSACILSKTNSYGAIDDNDYSSCLTRADRVLKQCMKEK